jgi:hypothetical protein
VALWVYDKVLKISGPAVEEDGKKSF